MKAATTLAQLDEDYRRLVVNFCACLTRVWFRRQLTVTAWSLVAINFSYVFDGLLRRLCFRFGLHERISKLLCVRLSWGMPIYYDYASHDETPLSVNTRSHAVAGAVSSPLDLKLWGEVAVPSERSQLDAWRCLRNVDRLTVSSAGSHQKLVQSHNVGITVLRIHGKRPVTFITDAVCSFGPVEANNAAYPRPPRKLS